MISAVSVRPLLAVTGSQRPYIFDLPHLLSLPKGFEFRFRYRHRWVESSLVRQIVDHGETFAGRQIVILFHSQDHKRLIPVRRGEVIAIESIGPMIFVRFRVGEFPALDLSIETYSRSAPETTIPALEGLGTMSQSLLGAIGSGAIHDLSNALPEGFYVREACQPLESKNWSTKSDSAAWARLAAILHGEPKLTGIPLFYVLGFRRETGASVLPQAIKNRFSPTREPIYGFSLVESERYRLQVVEWSEPLQGFDQATVKMRCEHNANHLSLEGASDLVAGRYDVIEFTFSACASGYSEVALRAEPLSTPSEASQEAGSDGSDPSKWANWPSIFVARIPVVIRRRARRYIVPILASGVGLALYMLVAPAVVDARYKAFLELVALGLLVVGVGGLNDVLGGIFNLGANLKKLKGGVVPTADDR